MKDRDRAGGFTLLELMVVLAVIAILALIALPNTMDRLVREQVAEALPLADVLKTPVEAAWRAGTPLPADNAAAGLPPPEKFVSRLVQSVRIENGAIHLTFGNSAHKLLQGKVLTLRPAGVESARIVPLAWLCGAAKAPGQMTVQGEDRTTVPVAMLPPRCR
jgi:type IV pilus assembly protein PilA